MANQKDRPGIRTSFQSYAILGTVVALSVFGGLGAWAALARIDSAVIAAGIVEVETKSKKIQHLEGGIVAEILVREHQKVKSGDVLLRLSPVQAAATLETHQNALDGALALEARLVAEWHQKDRVEFPDELRERTHIERIRSAVSDQRSLFVERREILAGKIDILKSKIEQLERQAAGTKAQIVSYDEQHRSLKVEFGKISELAQRGYYPINRVEDLKRRISDMNARYAQGHAELERMTTAMGEAKLQILQEKQKFKEEIVTQIREVRLKISELREKIRVARDLKNRLVIRAPLDGIVQNIQVHTIGGVVRSGDVLMEIVPVRDVFRVHAKVSPLDINYVRPGLVAEVRFPGIKARTTPLVLGRVISVSADIRDGGERKDSYFLAIVEVRQNMLPEALRERHLTAGMPTEVIISTGEQTVANYLIAPIADAARKTMRQH